MNYKRCMSGNFCSFIADDDNGSGLYDLSERIRQLNEEMAKEPPVSKNGFTQSSVRFSEKLVNFISPTPEQQSESEEDAGTSQNTPRTNDVEQTPNDSSEVSGLSSTKGEQSAESDHRDQPPSQEDGSRIRDPPSTLAVSPSEVQLTKSDVEDGSDRIPTAQSDSVGPDAEDLEPSKAESDEVSGSPSDKRVGDLSDRRRAVRKAVLAAAGVAGKLEESPRPRSADTKLEGDVDPKKTAADSGREDMALVECSGKFQMMSVGELTALQRRRPPQPASWTPRPPTTTAQTHSPRYNILAY